MNVTHIKNLMCTLFAGMILMGNIPAAEAGFRLFPHDVPNRPWGPEQMLTGRFFAPEGEGIDPARPIYLEQITAKHSRGIIPSDVNLVIRSMSFGGAGLDAKTQDRRSRSLKKRVGSQWVTLVAQTPATEEKLKPEDRWSGILEYVLTPADMPFGEFEIRLDNPIPGDKPTLFVIRSHKTFAEMRRDNEIPGLPPLETVEHNDAQPPAVTPSGNPVETPRTGSVEEAGMGGAGQVVCDPLKPADQSMGRIVPRVQEDEFDPNNEDKVAPPPPVRPTPHLVQPRKPEDAVQMVTVINQGNRVMRFGWIVDGRESRDRFELGPYGNKTYPVRGKKVILAIDDEERGWGFDPRYNPSKSNRWVVRYTGR